MGQRVKGRINSWTGGMSDDVRIQDLSSFLLAIGFDIFSNLKKISNMRSTEDSSTNSATTKGNAAIRRFLYSNSRLYGLGRVSSGDSHVQIYDKGSASITNNWNTSTNGTGTNGSVNYDAFTLYKNLIYGWAANRYIWAFSPAGAVFVDTAFDTGGNSSFRANGLATIDDLLLMPYDNKIAVKDGSATATANWEAARLTLPSQYTIVDLEEFGSLVAITCKSTNSNEATSKVFLWDKVSPDVTESIDIGEGVALLTANIDGELIIVMVTPDSTFGITGNLVLRKYTGGKNSEILLSIPSETAISTINFPTVFTKFRDSGRVSFVPPQIRIDGTDYNSLMTIGRRKAGYPIIATLAQNPNNDTAVSSVEGAFKLGSYIFYAINADGTIVRTNTSNAFSATATYISQKINGEPPQASRARRGTLTGQGKFQKKLLWAGITCPPLPTGSTLKLYYRTDANSGWTSIFQVTAANTQVYQQGMADTNLDGTPDAEFINFYEIQFKCTITGGTSAAAELMSIDFEYEILTAPTEE